MSEKQMKMGDESIPQYNFSVDVVEQTVDLRNFTIESTNRLGEEEMDEVFVEHACWGPTQGKRLGPPVSTSEACR